MEGPESTRQQAVRKKKISEMSREDLIVLVRDVLDLKKRAEDLSKQTEDENATLKSRLAKLVDDQRGKQFEEEALVHKIVGERDALKQKTVDLVTKLKSEQLKNAELLSSLENARLLLEQSDDRARELSASFLAKAKGELLLKLLLNYILIHFISQTQTLEIV